MVTSQNKTILSERESKEDIALLSILFHIYPSSEENSSGATDPTVLLMLMWADDFGQVTQLRCRQ